MSVETEICSNGFTASVNWVDAVAAGLPFTVIV